MKENLLLIGNIVMKAIWIINNYNYIILSNHYSVVMEYNLENMKNTLQVKNYYNS